MSSSRSVQASTLTSWSVFWASFVPRMTACTARTLHTANSSSEGATEVRQLNRPSTLTTARPFSSTTLRNLRSKPADSENPSTTGAASSTRPTRSRGPSRLREQPSTRGARRSTPSDTKPRSYSRSSRSSSSARVHTSTPQEYRASKPSSRPNPISTRSRARSPTSYSGEESRSGPKSRRGPPLGRGKASTPREHRRSKPSSRSDITGPRSRPRPSTSHSSDKSSSRPKPRRGPLSTRSSDSRASQAPSRSRRAQSTSRTSSAAPSGVRAARPPKSPWSKSKSRRRDNPSPKPTGASTAPHSPRAERLERTERTERPPRSKETPEWKRQKAALKEKFPEGWKPMKKLSPETHEGIRAIHQQYPDLMTTSLLASKFQVSPEAIRRILKSKWKPTAPEDEDRRQRWERRGESVYRRWVEERGTNPPKKWRQRGIGGGPRRLSQDREFQRRIRFEGVGDGWREGGVGSAIPWG